MTGRCVDSAIDGQVYAVDEARVVARKECDDTSDFFGLSAATERDAFELRPEQLRNFEKVGHVEVGEGDARTDGIDSYASGAKFDGEVAGEITHRPLCGVVGAKPPITAESGQGRYVYDCPLRLDEMRQNASRRVENAIDIDREHAMPFLDRQIQKAAARPDSCIVDENVDPAEAADGVGGQLLHVLDDRDVGGLDQATVAPETLPDLRQFFLPAAAQYDGGALGVKTTCGRGTDACPGTRHDDDLALEA